MHPTVAFYHLTEGGITPALICRFLLVIDAGSMARAAASSDIRPDQLSRDFHILTKWAGVPLLQKDGRTRQFTAEARQLAALLRLHLQALTDFRERCLTAPSSVSIGAGGSVCSWLLRPRLQACSQKLSRTTFQLRSLRTSEIIAALEQNDLDFGVIPADRLHRKFASAPVGTFKFALFIPRIRELQKLGPRGNLRLLLARVPLAGLSTNFSFGRQIHEISGRICPNFRVLFECESLKQAAEAVAAKECAAILPTLLVSAMREQAWIRRSPEIDALRRDYVLAWSKEAAQSRPALEAAARVLAATLTLPTRITNADRGVNVHRGRVESAFER